MKTVVIPDTNQQSVMDFCRSEGIEVANQGKNNLILFIHVDSSTVEGRNKLAAIAAKLQFIQDEG